MADLDTRSKRASSIQTLKSYVIAPPLPDGTIGQGDRQHIAFTYSGIVLGIFVYPLSGSITYTGNSPLILNELTVNPSSGTLIYIGFVPNIDFGQGLIISPLSGSITYTGNIPQIETLSSCWEDLSLSSTSWTDASDSLDIWSEMSATSNSWTNITERVCS